MFGRGGGIGPDLGVSELRGSVTQLAGRMWNHWPAMSEGMRSIGMKPPTFQGDELADVFAYLFVSRYDGQPSTRQRGDDVYRLKGCAVCHGPRGEGGTGPSLRKAVIGQGKEVAFQSMWNHGTKMREKMSAQQIPWPRFDADELAALFALLEKGWSEPPATAAAPKGAAMTNSSTGRDRSR
jgi:mono/diheme cytochrome c family protein